MREKWRKGFSEKDKVDTAKAIDSRYRLGQLTLKKERPEITHNELSESAAYINTIEEDVEVEQEKKYTRRQFVLYGAGAFFAGIYIGGNAVACEKRKIIEKMQNERLERALERDIPQKLP